MRTPPPRLPLEPGYLRDLFSRNARSYDPVNRLISLGLVASWRRQLVELAGIGPGERVLDAFCGPGTLGALAAGRVGPRGELVFADLSPVMLALARENLRTQCRRRESGPECPSARFVQTDVLTRPPGEGFDVVLLGFALRYAPQPSQALAGLARLLRPGGRMAVLEFAGARKRGAPWAALPRWYFHKVIPVLAGELGRGREVYDFLSLSSESFLTGAELTRAAQAAGLRPMLEEKMAGLVCLLIGVKEYS